MDAERWNRLPAASSDLEVSASPLEAYLAGADAVRAGFIASGLAAADGILLKQEGTERKSSRLVGGRAGRAAPAVKHLRMERLRSFSYAQRCIGVSLRTIVW